MNTQSTSLAILPTITLLTMSAFALEAPENDALPPPASQNSSQKLQPEPLVTPTPPQSQTAFLGVVSGRIPAALGAHLELPEDSGAMIFSLAPGGPAAQAGLVVNDVITKVAGQLVDSQTDLAQRVSAHRPGDTILLDLIHKGKPTTREVTLGTRPAVPADQGLQAMGQFDLEGFPEEIANRMRYAIAENLAAIELKVDPADAQDLTNQISQLMKLGTLQGSPQIMKLSPPAAGATTTHSSSSAVITMMDEKGCIEVKTQDGMKHVTIRDSQKNITWNGPWNTSQDKAAAPKDVRQRMEALNLDSTSNGNQLRFNCAPGEGAEN